MKQFSILTFLLLLVIPPLYAQITLPNGNKVDTVITVDVAYDETRLFFNTGKYKASNYLYQKITDSIHPQWLVTSCYNGECKNDLELNGRFLDDYGLNDSTCFIAFHVESHDVEGSSKIIYRVFNADDPVDEAYLEFYITYKKATSIYKNKKPVCFTAYPNPAKNALNISLPKAGYFTVKLIDVQGKILIYKSEQNTNKANLNTSDLHPGIYFLQIQTETISATEKIIIE